MLPVGPLFYLSAGRIGNRDQERVFVDLVFGSELTQ